MISRNVSEPIMIVACRLKCRSVGMELRIWDWRGIEGMGRRQLLREDRCLIVRRFRNRWGHVREVFWHLPPAFSSSWLAFFEFPLHLHTSFGKIFGGLCHGSISHQPDKYHFVFTYLFSLSQKIKKIKKIKKAKYTNPVVPSYHEINK